MPQLVPTNHRKPVTTYGRSSRSKLPSFQVFKDFESTEKIERNSGYNRISRSSSPKSRRSTNSDVFNGLISENEDPFADPAPPKKAPSKVPQYKQQQQQQQPKKQDGKKAMLSNKPANRPPPVINAAISHVTSTTARGIRPAEGQENPHTQIPPSKKPKLNPHTTPVYESKPRPVGFEVQVPRRPHKNRQNEREDPLPKDQDLMHTISGSKFHSRELKRRFSGIPSHPPSRPHQEPLKKPEIDAGGRGESSPASVRMLEMAKVMVNETKKVAGKFLKGSPSHSYKQWHDQTQPPPPQSTTSKLKNLIHTKGKSQSESTAQAKGSVTVKKKKGYERNCDIAEDRPDTQNGELQGIVPGSSKGNQENDYDADEDEIFELQKPPMRHEHRSMRRTESIRNFTLWREKEHTVKPTVGQDTADIFPIQEDREEPFPRTSKPAPAGYRKNKTLNPFSLEHMSSEMPSSSPIAESTPKKDWGMSEAFDPQDVSLWDAEAKRLEASRRLRNSSSLMLLDVADTDSDGDVAMMGAADVRKPDSYYEYAKKQQKAEKEKENKFRFSTDLGKKFIGMDNSKKLQEARGRNARLPNQPSEEEPKNPAAASGTSNKVRRRTKSFDLIDLSINGVPVDDSEHEGVVVAGTGPGRSVRMKDNVALGTFVLKKGEKMKNGMNGYAALPRTVSKKIEAKRASFVGRKKASAGYDDLMDVDDDVDELQMDLPGMRI